MAKRIGVCIALVLGSLALALPPATPVLAQVDPSIKGIHAGADVTLRVIGVLRDGQQIGVLSVLSGADRASIELWQVETAELERLTDLDRGTLALVHLACGAVDSDDVWDALDWTAAGPVTTWEHPARVQWQRTRRLPGQGTAFLNDSGTGIVFSRDHEGDVWLTWFKHDDSAFVEFGQDGMLLLDAVPSHHLPNVPRYVWSGPTITR